MSYPISLQTGSAGISSCLKRVFPFCCHQVLAQKKGPLIIGGFFVLFWVFSYILKCFEVTVFVIWRYTNRIELNMSIWAQDVGSRSTGKSTMTESRLLLCKESGMLNLNTLSFFCVFYCSWTWTCLGVSGDISSLKSGIAIRVSGGL